MKERPILFSAPMVRAILEGRKTMTRRAVKFNIAGRIGPLSNQWHIDSPGAVAACPYGQPGDQLWVRETFAHVHPVAVAENRYSQGNAGAIPGPPRVEYRTIYRADGEYPPVYSTLDWPFRALKPKAIGAFCDGSTWMPSIFMPRACSRITLEVTGVRVERLQDMTVAMAIAEGMRDEGVMVGDDDLMAHQVMSALSPGVLEMNAPLARFVLLWDSINGKQAGVTNWNANPLVWVVEFKRVTP